MNSNNHISIVGKVTNEKIKFIKGSDLFIYEINYFYKDDGKIILSKRNKSFNVNDKVELLLLNNNKIVAKDIYYHDIKYGLIRLIFLFFLFSYSLYFLYNYPERVTFRR